MSKKLYVLAPLLEKCVENWCNYHFQYSVTISTVCSGPDGRALELLVPDSPLTESLCCVLEQEYLSTTASSTGSAQKTGNHPNMTEKLLTGM